jgi:hypothetical protein
LDPGEPEKVPEDRISLGTVRMEILAGEKCDLLSFLESAPWLGSQLRQVDQLWMDARVAG